MSDQPPTRVRVTGPPRHHRRPAARSRLDTETPLGSLYVGSLVRAQRAAAIRTLLLLVLTVGAVPLVFHLAPGLADVELLGAPLPWLVVGVASYPVLFGLGWRHLRRSERIERDFADLVRREEDR